LVLQINLSATKISPRWGLVKYYGLRPYKFCGSLSPQ
jgi:hypothetical protein